MTGDPELALSVLYARLVEQRAAPVRVQDVLSAERAIVRNRFGGSRASYLAALARERATLAVARGAIGDELRRRELAERLAPRRVPSAAEVTASLGTYGSVRAREVELVPAPRWLPGGRGVVLPNELPDRVFALATGGELTIRTFDGALSVRAVGETMPLAAFPAAKARPAVVRALRSAAKADAYRDWTLAPPARRTGSASVRARPASDGRRGRADDVPAVSRARRRLKPDGRRFAGPGRLRYHPLSGWPG